VTPCLTARTAPVNARPFLVKARGSITVVLPQYGQDISWKTSMSGVFGATTALSDEQVDEVRELLRHRGRDASGVQRFAIGDGHVTFVHTRLAI
tara:strand:+ start:3704 stop:3985 length:282 start_codon:yes stop_codon:yes gene_type:complete